MKAVCNSFLAGSLAAVLALAGCGGGSGGGQTAGIGGTGKIASGTITGFGSIFVNGVEYETASADIRVDDSSASESDLRIGMVVTVSGSDDGVTGIADSVVFDDDIEGPVVSITTGPDGLDRTFSVLGTSVIVDSATTAFDDSTPGFSFSTLDNNDVVEISGFFDGAGVLHATFIEKKGVFPGITEVELKGNAANAGASGAGVGDTFTINGITVNILAGADLSEVPGSLVTDGMFVEVKGNLSGATTLNATRIEEEDTTIGSEGDEVSLEGLVSGFTGNLASFTVAGQPVNAASATLEPASLQLANGIEVEVEGSIVGGILVANSIEAREGEIKIDARVSLVSLIDRTISVQLGDGSITVVTDLKTEFEDETNVVSALTLADIAATDFVEIRAFDNGSELIATQVRRDSANHVILQGPVDSTIPGTSITVLGVSFFTDGSTQFEGTDDNPLPGGSATFYGTDRTGDVIKIRDNQPGDGTADEVDLES